LSAAGSSIQSSDGFVESSIFDWALDQFLNGGTDEGPQSGVIDFSGLSHEEKVLRGLLEPLFHDGGLQHHERTEQDLVREAIAWAAAKNWPSILSVFGRLLDVMADVMGRASRKDSPIWTKAAHRFANRMAQIARVFSKYEAAEWKPLRMSRQAAKWMKKPELAGEPLTVLDRLWLDETFQQVRKQLKGEKRSSAPQRQFVEHVVELLIGHPAANAAINGRKFMLYGIEWKTPKTKEGFDTVREVLMRMSLDNLHLLAEFMDESGMAGAAKKVRSLKSPEQKMDYWRESQLDEAFRAYFGLAKPRKKDAAQKPSKPLKSKASRRR
jgi:hypothetical protein